MQLVSVVGCMVRRMDEKEFNQQVGRNVAAIRRSRGMTQAELAQSISSLTPLSWYQQTVAKVESGVRALKFSDAVDLARALDVSTDDLLDQDGQAQATRAVEVLARRCEGTWSAVLSSLVDYGSTCRELEVYVDEVGESLPQDLLMVVHSILSRPIASTAEAAFTSGCSRWDEQHRVGQ